jgi:hypothetical protein
MFVVLGAMSIGILILPFAVLATVLVARRPAAAMGAPGLVSGLGLPFLFIAYLNRDGPGNVCHGTGDGGTSCVEEWTPWPWLLAGGALLLLGVFMFRRRQGLHEA